MMFPVYRGRAVQPGTAMTAHSDERSGATPMPDLPSPAAHPTVLAMQTPCSRSKSTYALPHPPETARRLFFRDQQLSPEQHIAFARCFGEIDVNRFFAAVPGYPMIAEVRKEPEQQRNIGNGWHTDHSYDEAPALGSMLYAREVPKTGGDTLFASRNAACGALSDGLNRPSKG
jgi:hypothetical protein